MVTKHNSVTKLNNRALVKHVKDIFSKYYLFYFVYIKMCVLLKFAGDFVAFTGRN